MLRAAIAGFGLALVVFPVSAQEWLYSPDISAVFSTVLLNDQDAANDNLAGSVTPLDLGPLPANTAVSALHRRPNGDRLFVLDVSTVLGSLFVTPRHVLRYDGNAYSVEFDGSTNGLPDGVRIDALSEAKGRLLLSLDGSVTLGALHVDDEDLVAFHNGSYQMVFDGSAAGIDPALDLDGSHADPDGTLLLSFGGSGHVNHLRFDDEDVLAYDPGTTQFSLVYDGSALQPAWSAADLDALAEPFPGTGAGPGDNQGMGKGHDKASGEGHARDGGRGHRK